MAETFKSNNSILNGEDPNNKLTYDPNRAPQALSGFHESTTTPEVAPVEAAQPDTQTPATNSTTEQASVPQAPTTTENGQQSDFNIVPPSSKFTDMAGGLIAVKNSTIKDDNLSRK